MESLRNPEQLLMKNIVLKKLDIVWLHNPWPLKTKIIQIWSYCTLGDSNFQETKIIIMIIIIIIISCISISLFYY